MKTLSDREATKVRFEPQISSVTELAELPAPLHLEYGRNSVELKTYKVRAVLVAWKEESGEKGDKDLHLVLEDVQETGATMIAEIPSPQCAGVCGSIKKQELLAARQTALLYLNRGAEGPVRLTRLQRPWIVEITGVGFFDYFHRQAGVAANCIELHPVLHIKFFKELRNPVRRARTDIPHACGK